MARLGQREDVVDSAWLTLEEWIQREHHWQAQRRALEMCDLLQPDRSTGPARSCMRYGRSPAGSVGSNNANGSNKDAGTKIWGRLRVRFLSNVYLLEIESLILIVNNCLT